MKPSFGVEPRFRDPWIFRNGSKSVCGRSLHGILDRELQRLLQSPSLKTVQLSTLITAGELESALRDMADASALAMAALTDALAAFFLGADLNSVLEAAQRSDQCVFPKMLEVSPPEGFTYYALNPMDFAQAASEMVGQGPIAVIGIRSIGTTLSAVVSANLRRQNLKVERITIRPKGHPYERKMQFSAEESHWIQRQKDSSASFLIVDEGPGRSGSTFLSVAEALEQQGVPVGDIRLLGSRQPNLDEFCSRNGKQRWNRFRFTAAVPQLFNRFHGCSKIDGGRWRDIFIASNSNWPATWPQMERTKYLSRDDKLLFKFEGLGHRGQDALERAQLLAARGFGCEVEDAGDGFAAYHVPKRRLMVQGCASAKILERIADYCALRSREFPQPDGDGSALAEMVRFNLSNEFGVAELCTLEDLHSKHTVLTDGKMQPFEWLETESGYLKTDATWHGDDHFFPGPTSIAWDLAGMAVEWNMDSQEIEFLLNRVREITGEDLRREMAAFVLSYAVLRTAWCKMAQTTVLGTPEETRLRKAYSRYRAAAQNSLREIMASEHLRVAVKTEAKLSSLQGNHRPEGEYSSSTEDSTG